MKDCITTAKQSTTKPCAYFLGYTVGGCLLYQAILGSIKYVIWLLWYIIFKKSSFDLWVKSKLKQNHCYYSFLQFCPYVKASVCSRFKILRVRVWINGYVVCNHFVWKITSNTCVYIKRIHVCLQHKALRPPYGSCGEYPLHLYDDGTTYTYSRCVEQCVAAYVAQQCNCTDSYMPGKFTATHLL